MTKPEYRLLAPAKEDLKKIRAYTTNEWGRAQWLEYWSILEETFTNLALNPKMGRIRDDIFYPNRRSFLEGRKRRHVIFYFEIEGGIAIYRVLHHSQDIENRFRIQEFEEWDL